MKTLNADLSTAQESGYPVSGTVQPAVRCIFTSKNGGTTYDYSFNPSVLTNRLQHIQQVEEPWNDTGVVLISNYDKSLPANLIGYHVDIGWGLNTISGLHYALADGAVTPRMWVTNQSDISGAPKGQIPQLYTVFELKGVWQAVLNSQPVRLGVAPYYRDDRAIDPDTGDFYISPYPGSHVIAELTGKTIYGVLEYLIETTLSAQTGLTFNLDALGTQDDGLINSIVPFPYSGDARTPLNLLTPGTFDTYGGFIRALLALTNCYLRPEPSLYFKVIFPQTSDAVNETYYSDMSMGHPFYQLEHNQIGEQNDGTALPNHIEVYGGPEIDPITGEPVEPAYFGEWYDPDHYTATVYDGAFMPVIYTIHDAGRASNAECTSLAEIEGVKLKQKTMGSRLIIPMDARLELYDRVVYMDYRGS